MTSSSEKLLTEARRAGLTVMFWAFFVSAGVNLMMLTSPLYMLQVYDRVIAARHVDTLIYLTLMAATALVVYAVLEGSRAAIGLKLGAWLERRFGRALIAATVAQAQSKGGGRGAPTLRDLSTLRGLFAGGGLWPLLDAPWSILFYGVSFMIHPWLGILGLAGGALLLLIAGVNEVLSRAPMKAAGQGAIQAVCEADAAIRNADAMLAMGMVPSFLDRWAAVSERALGHHMIAAQRSALMSALAKAVRIGLQIAILCLGAYLATKSEISGGAMVATSIIIGRAVAPLEQSIGAWRSIIAAQTAWQRIRDLLKSQAGEAERIRLPRPEGKVQAERLVYGATPGAEPIIRQVSFALEAGRSLAILGPSGAGKTTLLRLLVGSLQPQAGALRLDGGAVSAWADADKARYVGYLPQDVELFNATVRENIARFGEASDDEVVAAATLAGAHEMILRLPQGYATVLGAGGVRLSGGQRQRIGLARALFGDPRLVVLDEPNAHLDAEGEQALLLALRALKERSVTVVLVAQRLRAASMVDTVLMLRDGRVEAFGPRDQVMRPPAPAQEDRGRVLRVATAGTKRIAGGEG